jgi:hypothetical protein
MLAEPGCPGVLAGIPDTLLEEWREGPTAGRLHLVQASRGEGVGGCPSTTSGAPSRPREPTSQARRFIIEVMRTVSRCSYAPHGR